MDSLDNFIDQYLNYLLVEKGLASKTIEAYSLDLTRFVDFLEQHQVNNVSGDDTPIILKYLIAMRNAGLTARSRARHLVTIRGFYRFLVQEKDPQAIADVLIIILRQEQKFTSIRKNARKKMLSQFDWQSIADQYALLLKRATHHDKTV